MDGRVAAISEQGFALSTEGVLPHECAGIFAALSGLPRVRGRGGARHLLDIREVAALVIHPAIRNPVLEELGQDAFAFKATLFEKSAATNWFVGWHQDLFIPVAERVDAPGFSAWSEKDGVPHSQPPAEVLENILAVRLNLDPATPENGPLEVLPGSHRSGILSDAQIDECRRETEPVQCLTPAGGLIFMRPLLLHASAKMSAVLPRRVLHFEFAASGLPGGIEWHRRVGATSKSETRSS